MKTSIVWFKTDLRLHDNETLVKAIENSDEIIPVYCFDDSHYKISDFGFQKMGKFRFNFLLESLANLDYNLRQLGSGLLIVKGQPEIELLKLIKLYKVQKVYTKKEVAFEEIHTIETVEKELWKANCQLETFSTSTLYHAQDLPFTLKDIPEVFTNFRKKVEIESNIREVFKTPKVIKTPILENLTLPTLEEFGYHSLHNDKRGAIQFKGGETEGCKRIKSFFYETKAILNYKETRNEMIGENYSSKFSAWLALGCISPREIYFELKQFEILHTANESTYWLYFELLWRDYFRFMMKKHRHQFFLKNGIKSEEVKINKHDSKVFEKWINANTGNDFIDANMLELNHTGYMSNRGRQNVASYLCHYLNLDWRYGAAYFEQQLIDYDVCSNWGNWAYLAGVGNDPREKRIFNPEKQANDYDKNKKYRNLWLNRAIK